ncbi:MAG: hypothetical protein JXB45_03965 [Candidatus Krumholzibacteriota bacterium]|nr:hypothetical protein [Candidatus Krumholzibacteriota bacterium]
MVLLNVNAARGQSGQEIRMEMMPEQAARLNNPAPPEKIVEPRRDAEAQTEDRRNGDGNPPRRETIEAIRKRLGEEKAQLQERAREMLMNDARTYNALARLRETEDLSGLLIDEHG